jgi:enamine deaminase RidA (YjgF/YER057c/UK114 family)
MIRAVNTGLPDVGRPFEWAILADNVLCTVQLPLKMDGSFETGDIAAQTELTLTNLRRAVEAAGGTLADVTQVIVYLPDPQDFAAMNAVYGKRFSRPCPNRATLVSNLVVPGARIEIIAYAHINGAVKATTRAKKKVAKSAKRKAAPRKGTRRRS